jgi:hypothetical protein
MHYLTSRFYPADRQLRPDRGRRQIAKIPAEYQNAALVFNEIGIP